MSILYFDHVAEFFEQIDKSREPVGLHFALIAEVMAENTTWSSTNDKNAMLLLIRWNEFLKGNAEIRQDAKHVDDISFEITRGVDFQVGTF